MADKNRWQPVLTGDLAERAHAAVVDIAAELLANPTDDPTLILGNAGRALFFHYLASTFPSPTCGRAAEEHLDRAIEALTTLSLTSGLYAGYTGIAWVAEHMHPTHAEKHDSNQEID